MDEFLDLLKLTPGVAKVEEFRIPTLNGTPTKTPPRIVPEDRSEVNSQIKEMLDLNVIKTSNNPKKSISRDRMWGGQYLYKNTIL